LRLGVGVFSSEDGDMPTADFTIVGVSIAVDSIDAAQAYDVEVLRSRSPASWTWVFVSFVLAQASLRSSQTWWSRLRCRSRE
jgi:hypothetical protein